jgi:N-acetylglutamate synthase
VPPPDLASLELAALRSWPALETVEDDGWVLRFSRGYTQRSNSTTVLRAGPAQALPARVAACEAEFGARGLPPIFRVVSFAGAAALDALLAARGYRRKDETLVMTRPLGAPRPSPSPRGEVEALAPDAWLPLYERFNGKDAAQRPLHRALLEAIPGRRLLAALAQGGVPAAVGLAVVDGRWAGLFDVATDPARRRQGLGRRLVEGMLGWAEGGGAAAAYLQVVAANAPAVRLYARLGFAEGYRYWYRVPRA